MVTEQELKNYCKKYGVKNYSKLNKKELEELVNEHKRTHDRWGRKIGYIYKTIEK